jgi:hypothetical protein
MKDKYGYDIPDKANVMHIKTSKNSNPAQDKILETANILIDKAMETFPNAPPAAVNILMAALDYYFIREMQNQIERHERGEMPMYITVCATIMHALKILAGTSHILKIQMSDIFDYLRDKPELGEAEMKVMVKQMLDDGFFK